MVFIANLFVVIALIALGFVFKEIHDHWGYSVYMAFLGGWCFATIMWQFAHKSRYGRWFDAPDLVENGDVAGTADFESASNTGKGIGDGRTGELPPRAIKS